MAITDHSPHSAAVAQPDGRRRRAAGGRDRRGCASSYPGIAILHGCEVDILPDGRLDFPDRVLEQLRHRAGVAARARRPRARSAAAALRRGDAASAGHDDHAPDQPARAAPAAATTSTTTGCSQRPSRPARSLEIDGAPSHLDMDGALARRADRRRRDRRRSTATATAPTCSARQMELGRRHRAPRLGRAAARAEHAAARRGPRASSPRKRASR